MIREQKELQVQEIYRNASQADRIIMAHAAQMYGVESANIAEFITKLDAEQFNQYYEDVMANWGPAAALAEDARNQGAQP